MMIMLFNSWHCTVNAQRIHPVVERQSVHMICMLLPLTRQLPSQQCICSYVIALQLGAAVLYPHMKPDTQLSHCTVPKLGIPQHSRTKPSLLCFKHDSAWLVRSQAAPSTHGRAVTLPSPNANLLNVPQSTKQLPPFVFVHTA
jgi:hypothetical protein